MATANWDTEAIYGHISGRLLDPELVKIGRRLERERMDHFGVFRRVLLSTAT